MKLSAEVVKIAQDIQKEINYQKDKLSRFTKKIWNRVSKF